MSITEKPELIKARNKIKTIMSYYLKSALGWARFFINKDWASVWAKVFIIKDDWAKAQNIIRGQKFGIIKETLAQNCYGAWLQEGS